MKKSPLELIGIIITAILLVFLGFFIFRNQASAPVENETNQSSGDASNTSKNNQIANPASANCENLGGTITIKDRGDDGQYGLCEFGEGMACEEWTLYNEYCPAGGVDISGLETEEQKYCLWLGGNLTQSTSTCTLPDEEICDTDKLFNGACPAN